MTKKTEMITIRCSKDTKMLWIETLYEMKKRGWSADELLLESLRAFRNSPRYISGKIY